MSKKKINDHNKQDSIKLKNVTILELIIKYMNI